MAELNKNDYKQIKDAILYFNSLTLEQQNIVGSEIDALWMDVCNEFSRRCSEDKELNELYDYIEDFRKVTNFSIEEHYKKYSYTVNEFDPEESRDIYDYDLNALLTAKDIYENLEEYKKILNSKIEKIQNSRFAINKENRIKKLQVEIKKFEDVAKYYGKLKEEDDLKNEYMKTKFLTYTKNKDRFHELTNKYANDVICDAIKTNPEIVCIERKSFFSNGFYPNYDKYALNDASNKIRQQVLDTIKKENEEMFDSLNEKEQ